MLIFCSHFLAILCCCSSIEIFVPSGVRGGLLLYWPNLATTSDLSSARPPETWSISSHVASIDRVLPGARVRVTLRKHLPSQSVTSYETIEVVSVHSRAIGACNFSFGILFDHSYRRIADIPHNGSYGMC